MQTDPKSILREKFLTLLRQQKEEDRLKKSSAILKELFSCKEFKDSKLILFYASFDGEVDTLDMMRLAKKLGKRIALPAIIKDQKAIVPTLVENFEKELKEGAYGIKEPIHSDCVLETKDIDLVIVPGIVFDHLNNRLGRGLGFYDRFLKKLPVTTPTIGLAFDFQLIARLPLPEKHDVPVSKVITN